MTNANLQNKIRIYDLARDLGRDNKDVLAVCQRLGITFKSHSSTISEQEAEQIRDAFQRGLPPGGRKKNKILQQGGVSGKQQILEVRRPPANYQPPTKPTDLIEVVEPQTVVEVVPPAIESVPVELPVIAVELPVEEPVVEAAAVSAPVAETLSVQEAVEVLDVAPPVVEEIVPIEVPIPEEPVAAEPDVPAPPVEPAPLPAKAVPTRPERQERRPEDGAATPSSGRVQPKRSVVVRPAAKGAAQQPQPQGRPGGSNLTKRSNKPGVRPGTPSMRRRDDQVQSVVEEQPKILGLSGNISLQDLAGRMSIPTTEIIKALFMKGIMVNINQTLDQAMAELVAKELGFEVRTEEATSQAIKTEMLDIGDLESLEIRPPVVTIMGHVDHGKTSLLDAIRNARVAEGEAGGITQRIGAYRIEVPTESGPRQLVFLDTPGHEAFTAMRARGAKVTDITVLVVAADDGVKPQTVEAISHAKAAGVPIVVAINKIDKADANPDRVKQELTEYDLVPEEWGGKTVMVPVSARQQTNLDLLLENLLLVADFELELMANPNRLAKGTIIEANLDKARGPVATALVQNGTLKVGDTVVVGAIFGKVRALYDDHGRRVETAGPSTPVEVLGLTDVPLAGDEFEVYLDEREARRVAEGRALKARESRMEQSSGRRVSLGNLSVQAQEGELKDFNVILKADVQGSIEAIRSSLEKIPQGEVQLRLLFAAPGEISETDIDLAAASNAVILGFNTTLASGARQAAEAAGVDVRDYDVIYKLLEDVQLAMEGMLAPELIEEPLGMAEVRAVFTVGKNQVAGCYVKEGKLLRNCLLRVRRGKEVVFEGHIDSLKRFKEDAKEVATGYECGVGSDNFTSWQAGDAVEAYRMVTQKRTL